MAHQFAPVNAPIMQSDSAALVSSVMERDSNGDSFVRDGNASRDLVAARNLKAGGGIYKHGIAKSANFVVDDLATLYVVDTTGGNVTATLPAAASSTDKVIGFVKKVAGNNMIMAGNAAETINGSNTLTKTAQYASVFLWCDGSAWYILSAV